jgi:hypothetical protein
MVAKFYAHAIAGDKLIAQRLGKKGVPGKRHKGVSNG